MTASPAGVRFRRSADADRRQAMLLIVIVTAASPWLHAVGYGVTGFYRVGNYIFSGAMFTALFWLAIGMIVLAVQRSQRRAAGLVALVAVALDAVVWRKADAMGTPSLTDVLAMMEFLRTLSGAEVVAAGLGGLVALLAALAVLVPNLCVPNGARIGQLLFGGALLGVWFGTVAHASVTRNTTAPLHVAYGVPGALTYDALARRTATRILARSDPETAPVVGLAQAGPVPPDTRTIHVIVVESWMMASRFPGGRSVTDPRLRAWSDATGPGLVAPVFGGRSAEARFEMLCGLPSADPANRVPHWRIHRPLTCLPRLFTDAGFAARASTPGPTDVFQVGRVLPLLGFSTVWFREDYPPPYSEKLYYPAERALQVDLGRLVPPRAAPDDPVFTWHVVLQGHWPWPEQPVSRPSPERWQIALAAATRAVADRVEALRTADPDALILVAGDHAPPDVVDEPLTDAAGRLTDLTVPVALLGPAGPIPLPLMAHWEVPYRVLDLATGGWLCRRIACPPTGRDAPVLRPLKDGILVAERDGAGARLLAFDDPQAAAGTALLAVTERLLQASADGP